MRAPDIIVAIDVRIVATLKVCIDPRRTVEFGLLEQTNVIVCAADLARGIGIDLEHDVVAAGMIWAPWIYEVVFDVVVVRIKPGMHDSNISSSGAV